MSHLVLARKFRPAAFDAVSGQEHVTRALKNSILRDKIAHAYIFAGPRGVGKTSIARIFSKSLNCESRTGIEPCQECLSCREITQGISLGVLEIDGASHNSVDNVRDLIDSFRSLPPPGYRYKVYIIDEVHMLSTSAFNALLKSLEEPPPHTVFILATTELHKIPETVISRCQRHDFRALSVRDVEKRLEEIARSEKMEIEPAVIRLLARLADGSMRDSQSLLERVQAYCDGPITLSEVEKVVGAVGATSLFALSGAIFRRDPSSALATVDEVFSVGTDTNLFLKEFAAHMRTLLLARTTPSILSQVGVSESEVKEYVTAVEATSLDDIQDIVHLARSGLDEALRSSFPRYALEALVVRLATRRPVVEFGRILAALQSPRAPVAQSSPPSTSAQQSPPPPSPKQGGSIIAPAPVSSGFSSSSPAPGLISWQQLVAQMTGDAGAVFVENIKRVVVKRFEAGVLSGQASSFCLKYFREKANIEKLESLLTKITGVGQWKIDITEAEAGAATAPEGSVHGAELAERAAQKKTKEAAVVSHPSVKSLQKAFPGSTIDRVSVQEE